jgi:16S rRNA (adenine1518-N6/adenine1519-N6)-dimethyltransferase
MTSLPNRKPISVRALLNQFGITPKKSLGQNFLADGAALRKILAAAEITPADQVLEIGPGLGNLTVLLAEAASHVVAVEIDDRFLAPLEHVLAGCGNVLLVHGDILALDPSKLVKGDRYLVVANIPYYITSAVIRHLLEVENQPRRLVLTVQREVAQRICAQPGKLSLLALSVQIYGRPKIYARIPAGAFYPPPKVDSSVVRIDLFEEPMIPPDLREAFFRLVKAGFSQKRKTLRNALAAGLHWSKGETEAMLTDAEIDPGRRAETLTVDEWGALTARYKEKI